MVIVEPIVMAYHLAVEGNDPRMDLVTSLFLWWALALAGSAANFRRWKQLGRHGRLGLIILTIMAVGFTPVVFVFLLELGPSIVEIYLIMLGISR
jgi:hypothetical protein